jgi:hypothetical protein
VIKRFAPGLVASDAEPIRLKRDPDATPVSPGRTKGPGHE